MRVVESGRHAAAREVDALGRDGRAIALADVDAARNARASNGDCACPRQTWVACEHRTALEDHRRRVATIAVVTADALPRPRRARSSSPGSRDFATVSQRPGSTPRCSSRRPSSTTSPARRRTRTWSSPSRASRCCSCAATSSGRAPRARSRRSSRSRACAGSSPRSRGLGLGPGAAIGLELDVLPAASYLRYAALLPERPARRRDAGGLGRAGAEERVGARARPCGLRAGHGGACRRCPGSCGSAARGRPALRARRRDARARPRGHRPLPRAQRRVLVRAGARGPVGRGSRADRHAARRPRASPRRRAAAPRAGRSRPAMPSWST